MSKKSIIIGGALSFVIILGCIFISYSSNISNPLLAIKGIFTIERNNSDVEKISNKPLTFITKHSVDLLSYMESLGYVFEYNDGNEFFFSKENESTLLKSKQFTKKYITWKEK